MALNYINTVSDIWHINNLLGGVSMNPRAGIMVYGLWNGICRGRHGKGRAMGALFNELLEYIKQSDIWADVDVYFVDLMVNTPGEEYRMIKNLMDAGYKLPYVMINGKLKFFGSIPVWETYSEAKRYIEYGYIYE
jgi:hypothetical protein